MLTRASMIVLALSHRLPRRYVAAPHVHLGSAIEIDVATYQAAGEAGPQAAGPGDGGAGVTGFAVACRPEISSGHRPKNRSRGPQVGPCERPREERSSWLGTSWIRRPSATAS